jgi:5-methylcytosine-specific restriction protein B
MSIDLLRDVVHSTKQDSWTARNKEAFDALFGGTAGRYPKAASKTVVLRAPEMSQESGVPFAAYIHPSNPSSGPYSGLSFVIFPVQDRPALVGLVIGTQGLTPDEAILGRPGHARKVQAICSWLNREYGKGSVVAWAKHDPTRTDLGVPKSVREMQSSGYKDVFDRYGKEIYAVFFPSHDQTATSIALKAFLDLLFEERDHSPMTGSKVDSD